MLYSSFPNSLIPSKFKINLNNITIIIYKKHIYQINILGIPSYNKKQVKTNTGKTVESKPGLTKKYMRKKK